MPLSNKDLSEIAREYATAKSDQVDDKAAIPNIQEQIVKKEAQVERTLIPYNNAQIERVVPYETEHRWLDGTTYNAITTQQIIDAGNRITGNIFFPLTWSKSNAKLTTSGNGNPKTSSGNNESSILYTTVENQGLVSQINLLRNGQSSARPADNLSLAYPPGTSTIEVNDVGHTNGNLLYISGSGTSALVKVTNVVGTTLTITEIIAPQNTISAGGTVVENIPGFTNSERNTITSSNYQNILTNLTNRIISSATLWNIALNNQLTQLNINIDAAAQVTIAKTNINVAKTAYDVWFALANTGASGKFVDVSLNNLAIAYNTRISQIPIRASQITAALGSVSQDVEGNYSGNGVYLQRFKTLNFLINGANGPLFELSGLRMAKSNFEQKIINTADKLATYNNIVRYGAFIANPSGTVVKVDGASQFSNGENVLLTGNDLPSIQCTVNLVSGSNITLNITIPKEYTKASKAGIIKAV